jgi:hypothetical protein
MKMIKAGFLMGIALAVAIAVFCNALQRNAEVRERDR